jgi:isopentenyl diphosphate isomerase/L-lactate dehydrogenase-like FMN-dependent dehydrogenase
MSAEASTAPAAADDDFVNERGPKVSSISGLASVADFRARAKRRLPKAIFDFVDGGAGDEHTLKANEEAFQRYTFHPRVLTDVSHIDVGTTILGKRSGLPLFLGPSGTQRIVSKEGELAAVRAAARFGTVYVLTVGASRTIEQVAAAGRGARLWFQLYLWQDREWSESLLRRAESAGYEALVVTVDIKSPGGRKYRDIRNRITSMPDSLAIGTLVDAALHPRWVYSYFAGGSSAMAHVESRGRNTSVFRASTETWRRMDPSATWDEISWLRRVWKGKLVVKGLVSSEDAEEAYRRGADAVVCSNHGGRALDGSPATLDVLPEFVEVARREGREVYLDGGVRTGQDLVKALALGANGCLIARPFWWGLATAGEKGVAAVLGLFRDELVSTLTLLGKRSVRELEPSDLRERPGRERRA